MEPNWCWNGTPFGLTLTAGRPLSSIKHSSIEGHLRPLAAFERQCSVPAFSQPVYIFLPTFLSTSSPDIGSPRMRMARTSLCFPGLDLSDFPSTRSAGRCSGSARDFFYVLL